MAHAVKHSTGMWMVSVEWEARVLVHPSVVPRASFYSNKATGHRATA